MLKKMAIVAGWPETAAPSVRHVLGQAPRVQEAVRSAGSSQPAVTRSACSRRSVPDANTVRSCLRKRRRKSVRIRATHLSVWPDAGVSEVERIWRSIDFIPHDLPTRN